jgi:hypothetical protein
MSEKVAELAFRAETREVAMKIYTDLIARNITVDANGVKTAVSPENLAQLSYKLAAVFLQVHEKLNEANMPKNTGYTLDQSDIASWMK